MLPADVKMETDTDDGSIVSSTDSTQGLPGRTAINLIIASIATACVRENAKLTTDLFQRSGAFLRVIKL